MSEVVHFKSRKQKFEEKVAEVEAELCAEYRQLALDAMRDIADRVCIGETIGFAWVEITKDPDVVYDGVIEHPGMVKLCMIGALNQFAMAYGMSHILPMSGEDDGDEYDPDGEESG